MDNAAYDLTYSERRCCQRMPVMYMTNLSNGSKPCYVTASNISEKGIGIVSPHCISSGKIVDLKVKCYLSFGGNFVNQFYLDLTAKTIWSIQEGENKYRCGLKIINFSGDVIHKLKNHLQILFLQSAVE